MPINARAKPALSGYIKELSFSSLHPNGCQFVLADGSVRYVPYNIDTTTYQGMGSRGMGESLRDF